MATIRLCDWTKKRLKKDEVTFRVVVDGEEFEVGQEGRDQLLKTLESENEPVALPPTPKDPPPPPLTPAIPAGIQIETDEDPFEPEAESELSQSEQVALLAEETEIQLEIPDDIRKKLKMPSPKVADAILMQAKKFEEGSLPSLDRGSQESKTARQKLREIEDSKEGELKSRAPKGFRIGYADLKQLGLYQE